MKSCNISQHILYKFLCVCVVLQSGVSAGLILFMVLFKATSFVRHLRREHRLEAAALWEATASWDIIVWELEFLGAHGFMDNISCLNLAKRYV